MKPKPFWVLKNFTVPTGIVVPFTLNAGALIAQAATSAFWGVTWSAAQDREASEQGEAENQVAAGDINGFRLKVNAGPGRTDALKP